MLPRARFPRIFGRGQTQKSMGVANWGARNPEKMGPASQDAYFWERWRSRMAGFPHLAWDCDLDPPEKADPPPRTNPSAKNEGLAAAAEGKKVRRIDQDCLGGHGVPSRSPVLPPVPKIPYAPGGFFVLPPETQEEGLETERFLVRATKMHFRGNGLAPR